MRLLRMSQNADALVVWRTGAKNGSGYTNTRRPQSAGLRAQATSSLQHCHLAVMSVESLSPGTCNERRDHAAGHKQLPYAPTTRMHRREPW
mmetsp:Transcript_6578/g.17051  ORF Transcript_6578/g.17051 Transcript_6578/m.17051 type:complete len:91 (+) Transcript_6578:185-457(+)